MIFVVVVGILGLMVLANSAAASPKPDRSHLLLALLVVLNVSVLSMAGLLLLTSLVTTTNDNPLLTGFTPQLAQAFVGPLAGASLWGLLALWPMVRRFLAQFTSINPDSPVHTLALVLSGYLIANTAVTLNQGGVAELAESADAASIGSLLLTGLALLAAALVSVGLGTRRTWAEVIERLGLRPLRVSDWRVILSGILFLLTMEIAITFLLSQFYPEQLAQLENVNIALLSDLDSLGEWLILGLTSGVGEELLFRGAIQPAFGILPTAILFAVAHVQYDFSPLMIFIFLLGVVLGLIRQRISTTTAILVHFGYNFALGLLTLFAGSV